MLVETKLREDHSNVFLVYLRNFKTWDISRVS